jgi:predicted metalloprotease with PDZ domain
MPLFPKAKVLFGFGMGIAAAGLAREVLPAFQGFGRPLAKAALKSGLMLLDRGKVRLAQFEETLQDLTAEARAELEAETRAARAQGAAAGASTAQGGSHDAERVYRA